MTDVIKYVLADEWNYTVRKYGSKDFVKRGDFGYGVK